MGTPHEICKTCKKLVPINEFDQSAMLCADCQLGTFNAKFMSTT